VKLHVTSQAQTLQLDQLGQFLALVVQIHSEAGTEVVGETTNVTAFGRDSLLASN
jgi:hypothetical protein